MSAGSSAISRQYSLLFVLTFYCYLNALPPCSSVLVQNTNLLTKNTTNNTNNSDRYPFASTRNNQPAITARETLNAGHNQGASSYPTQQHQPKSLKFTLIAGKYWKFNIKANSLQTSHKEKELRLHRNVSTNNFIIDDDGWFQYNHQQQQLFAWPSLSTKPATYYFVLLPSGLDFEAEGENVINNSDIVANIVVELIRPHYQSSKFDIDQFVDHKFSLDYIHRHSSYPLLLNQLVSIIESLARSNSSLAQSTSYNPATVLSMIQQNKHSRLANKLNEYLLIDSSYTPDGELFSLTWTTHPSLINNTITPIDECRLASIIDIVTKLSSPSLGYQSDNDKFVVYYSLEAPSVNSHAIIPTERGNYALKLILNGSCRKQKIIDQLGIAPSPSNLYIGVSTDVDDIEKSNIFDRQAPSTKSPLDLISTTTTISTTSTTSTFSSPITTTTTTTANPPITSSLNQEAIEPNTALQQQQIIAPTPTITTESSRVAKQTPTELEVKPTIYSTPLAPLSQQPQILANPLETKAVPTPETSTITAPPQPALDLAAQNSLSDQRIHNAQVFMSERPSHSQQHQQQQNKPQAKSFANFLDLPDANFTMSTTTLPTISPSDQSQTTSNTTPTTISSISDVPSPSSTPQETSINEDLIGILNEVMDYLVSVAVPVSVIIGIVLLTSIIVATCSLCIKKRRSKQFEVGNRFKFRYGSERRQFLKNSSKPVILEADQKSLSTGGTPQHKAQNNSANGDGTKGTTYLKMKAIKLGKKNGTSNYIASDGSNFFDYNMACMSSAASAGVGYDGGNCGGGGYGGGDCGGSF